MQVKIKIAGSICHVSETTMDHEKNYIFGMQVKIKIADFICHVFETTSHVFETTKKIAYCVCNSKLKLHI